jgi:hypothetical protein
MINLIASLLDDQDGLLSHFQVLAKDVDANAISMEIKEHAACVQLTSIIDIIHSNIFGRVFSAKQTSSSHHIIFNEFLIQRKSKENQTISVE